MRKYYADLLQNNSAYKRKMRNIKLKHKMLIECSQLLTTSLNLGGYEDSLPFYLAAIAFPTDLRKILNKGIEKKPENQKEFESCKRVIDTIECALTRYSKKVLDDFIKMPEICKLLLNYLKKVRNEEYQEHYEMLTQMAKVSLEKSNFNSAFKAFRNESRVLTILDDE
jgi:hypothetical protein